MTCETWAWEITQLGLRRSVTWLRLSFPNHSIKGGSWTRWPRAALYKLGRFSENTEKLLKWLAEFGNPLIQDKFYIKNYYFKQDYNTIHWRNKWYSYLTMNCLKKWEFLNQPIYAFSGLREMLLFIIAFYPLETLNHLQSLFLSIPLWVYLTEIYLK